MKITSKSRYAVRAIYAMCRLGGDKRPVNMSRILEVEDISKKYLERIFSELKANNIIEGARGSRGGYMLAKSPADISLKEIIDVTDGPLEAEDCTEGKTCGNYSSCSVNWIWEGLKRSCDDYLSRVTVSDMMKGSKAAVTLI